MLRGRPPLEEVPLGIDVVLWREEHPENEPFREGGTCKLIERTQRVVRWACGACKAEGRAYEGELPIPSDEVWVEAAMNKGRAPEGYEMAKRGEPGCPKCAQRWTE